MVGDPVDPDLEAGVVCQVLEAGDLQDPGPELLRAGQVQRDHFPVGADEGEALRRRRAAVRARLGAVAEVARIRLGQEVRHRLEHRDLHDVPAAVDAPPDERGHDALGRVKARDRVGDRRAGDARRPRVQRHAQHPAVGLRDRVVRRTLCVGAVGAEAADRAVDQARVEAEQALGADVQALGGAGSEVVDEHVGGGDQVVEDLLVSGVPVVDGDAALVVVKRLERRGVHRPVVAAEGIAGARLLHLDDVGAKVRQQHRRERAGDEGPLLDDAQTVQRTRALAVHVPPGRVAVSCGMRKIMRNMKIMDNAQVRVKRPGSSR
ncbi:MAG TPA: hypothetical protein VK817_21315 [Trebonia sp.]|nr:hypothetical protein [Trebonia sp.]